MIGTIPAFELLRQNNLKCEPATEQLVLKTIRGKITQEELLNAFEKGITGEYGKVYKADPQTLIGWVDSYLSVKNSPKNYLDKGCLNPLTKMGSKEYPQGYERWKEEVNRCYTAFLNGVKEDNFHPHVYDTLILDNKISLNACQKYFNEINLEYVRNAAAIDFDEENLMVAKQKVLRDLFITYKQKAFTYVYWIPVKE